MADVTFAGGASYYPNPTGGKGDKQPAASGKPGRTHFAAATSGKPDPKQAQSGKVTKDIASNVNSAAPSDKAKGGSAGAAAASAANNTEQIGTHMAARGGHHGRFTQQQVLKLLNVPGEHRNSQKRFVQLRKPIKLSTLLGKDATAAATILIDKATAESFKKSVYRPKTKETVLLGDPDNCQITRVRLIKYSTFLPVDVSLDVPALKGNMAPCIIDNGSGMLVTNILEAETAENLRDKPILIYENTNVISQKKFSTWAGVTEERLRAGSHKHPVNPDIMIVELSKNQLMRLLLNENLEGLERNYESLDVDTLAHELERSNGSYTEMPTEVHNKLVEIGMQYGVNPVSDNITKLEGLAFQLLNSNGEKGSFKNLRKELEAAYGKDAVEGMLDQTYMFRGLLEIHAVIAGTEEAESQSSEPASGATTGNQTPVPSDGESSGDSSAATSDAE